ncbi:hypothetical protein RchiOBHm_Chr1g0361561 [Rosa chinensis]|uniref:Uncharacterized protein n=1 Tax=Rosa chinensis TaxID=74649 RepID=A0A2P6SIW6_ROSCH|nr:hypothetical protein RchiOBHm_Chr1g0361561 [Rosa chinensis]
MAFEPYAFAGRSFNQKFTRGCCDTSNASPTPKRKRKEKQVQNNCCCPKL